MTMSTPTAASGGKADIAGKAKNDVHHPEQTSRKQLAYFRPLRPFRRTGAKAAAYEANAVECSRSIIGSYTFHSAKQFNPACSPRK